MGQAPSKLAVHHLAFGVQHLLSFLTNDKWRARCREEADRVKDFLARVPESEASFGYNAVKVPCRDGVIFELFETCTKSPEMGYSWETCMRWWYAEAERKADGTLGFGAVAFGSTSSCCPLVWDPNSSTSYGIARGWIYQFPQLEGGRDVPHPGLHANLSGLWIRLLAIGSTSLCPKTKTSSLVLSGLRKLSFGPQRAGI